MDDIEKEQRLARLREAKERETARKNAEGEMLRNEAVVRIVQATTQQYPELSASEKGVLWDKVGEHLGLRGGQFAGMDPKYNKDDGRILRDFRRVVEESIANDPKEARSIAETMLDEKKRELGPRTY